MNKQRVHGSRKALGSRFPTLAHSHISPEAQPVVLHERKPGNQTVTTFHSMLLLEMGEERGMHSTPLGHL